MGDRIAYIDVAELLGAPTDDIVYDKDDYEGRKVSLGKYYGELREYGIYIVFGDKVLMMDSNDKEYFYKDDYVVLK